MRISKFISMLALLVLAFAFSAFAGESKATVTDFMESETPRVVIIADSASAAGAIQQIIAENFGDAGNIVVITTEDSGSEPLIKTDSIVPSQLRREVPILTARMRETFYLVPRNSHFDNEYLPADRQTQIFNDWRNILNFKPKPEIVRTS